MKTLLAVFALTLAAGCATTGTRPHSTPPSNTGDLSAHPPGQDGAPATAPSGTPTPAAATNELDFAGIAEKVHNDVQAAHDAAKQFGDPLGLQCWTWVLDNPLNLPNADVAKAAVALPTVGLISGFEKARIGVQVLRDSKASVMQQLTPGSKWRTGLAQGCGPLLVDANVTVNEFLVKLGLGRLLGGAVQ